MFSYLLSKIKICTIFFDLFSMNCSIFRYNIKSLTTNIFFLFVRTITKQTGGVELGFAIIMDSYITKIPQNFIYFLIY